MHACAAEEAAAPAVSRSTASLKKKGAASPAPVAGAEERYAATVNQTCLVRWRPWMRKSLAVCVRAAAAVLLHDCWCMLGAPGQKR